MAKAKKRNRKMSRIATVPAAIRAYGGVKAMAKPFDTTPESIEQWKRWGEIPCTEHLGLAMGLKRGGYELSPS